MFQHISKLKSMEAQKKQEKKNHTYNKSKTIYKNNIDKSLASNNSSIIK